MRRTPWIKPAKEIPWYFLGLALMGAGAWGFSCFHSRFLRGRGISGWVGMAGTAVFLLLAIAAHVAGRKRGKPCYILSYCLNLLSAGFSAGVYYACTGVIPTAMELLSGGIWAAVAGAVVCAGMCYPGKRWQIAWLLLSLLAALGLIGYSICIWVRGPVVGSFQTFCALAFLFFVCACAGNRAAIQEPMVPEYLLSIAGFGAFGLITAAVIFALTEGEILESIGEFFAELFADILGELLPGRKKAR